ncbi:MAG: hypothetical protein EOO03_10915, partial [Chitinophagaceae bacterium]
MHPFLRVPALSALVLLASGTQAFSQKDAVNYQKAVDYKKQYADQEAVALDVIHDFTFSIDKTTKQPMVLEEESLHLMSLRVNNNLYHLSFYNDNSRITKAELKKDRKEVYLSTACGNYEVDNIFHSDAKVCSYRIPFEKAGDQASMYITKKYTDLRYFTTVYLPTRYPAEKREITFTVPDGIDVEIKEFNFEGYDIEKSKVYNPKAKETKHVYKASKLRPLVHENNTRGNSFVYPHLLVLTKSYVTKEGTQKLLGSTDDLYGWYSSLTREVKNDRAVLEPLVKSLTEGKATDEQKIKALYYWVQDNIRYIAFEAGIAGFKPEAAHEVYQKKYGDCKGMANLTKEMLKIAGFDARLTWIGTNSIAYDYSLPSLAVDNHMVCTVFLNGRPVVLDATEKYISFNDYGERIQGRPILVEEGDKYQLLKVPVVGKERNLISREHTQRIEGNTLIGSAKVKYNGESKTGILYSLNRSKTEKRKEILENFANMRDRNITVAKVLASDLSDRENPFTLTFDFEAKNRVSVFENDMYLTIDPEQDFKNMDVEAKRVSDLYFDEKVFRKSRITLQIPEGYKVSHLPASLKRENPSFSFNINITQQ